VVTQKILHLRTREVGLKVERKENGCSKCSGDGRTILWDERAEGEGGVGEEDQVIFSLDRGHGSGNH